LVLVGMAVRVESLVLLVETLFFQQLQQLAVVMAVRKVRVTLELGEVVGVDALMILI
jgi:hypothetical protein